ncbi:MAG: hypothetical protein QOH00_3519 [Gaiellales bacterium]|nr:hypothetical protein [Gaiellales bacterium]
MTLRDPLWRNLGILAVIAALLTAAGQGGRVGGIVFVILRVIFLLVLVGVAFSVWRQNRGTFGLMPLRSRILLYGSAIGLVLLIATADLWASSSAPAALLFFAALFGCGYVLYRCWQESRRYFY